MVGGVQAVTGLLISRDFPELYRMMSNEFKEVFSEDAFVSSFSSSIDVTSGQLIGSPMVYGADQEWAEQVEELTLNDGTVKKYSLIFHKEEGQWLLYGTEEDV